MQINVDMPSTQAQSSTLRIHEGAVYRARVLERDSGNQALLGLRGTKINASFEGGLPSHNKVAFQVTGQKDGIMQVKTLQQGNSGNGSGKALGAAGILRNIGIQQPSNSLTAAAKIMLQAGSPLTKDTASSVQRFIEQTAGGQEQKLTTIKAAATKNITINNNNLQNIHEGLHNKSSVDFMNNVTNSTASSNNENSSVSAAVSKAVKTAQNSGGVKEIAEDIQQKLHKGGSLDEAVKSVKNRIMNHPDLSREDAARIEKALKEAEHLTSTGKERLEKALQTITAKETGKSQVSAGELLQQIQQLRQSGDNENALQQDIKQLLQNNGIQGKEAERVMKLVNQLQQLDEAGKQRMIKSLNNLLSPETVGAGAMQAKGIQSALMEVLNNLQTEPDMKNVLQQMKADVTAVLPENSQNQVSSQIETAEAQLQNGKEMASRQTIHQAVHQMQESVGAASSYGANAQQTAAPFEMKQMLETKVTDRMLKMTDDFKQLKQNTVKQLDQASKLIEQDRQAGTQAKQVLEAAIKKMDRSILRSDFMLFTDMKTERKMLQASSQLTEARQLLAKGRTQEAFNIIKEVQKSVETMEFKASEQKAKNVITREETAALDKSRGRQAALQQTMDQSRAAAQEPSSRQMFELVRSLGLNRESEIGQMLSTSQKNVNAGSQPQNMKDALLHLLKNDDNGTQLQQKSNQSLSNLTGQQLMSKSDQGQNMQQLLFNLPVPMKDKFEQLQVYVHSRQEQGQMDWENCNLYFQIETPSLGETGIMIQSAERQLSITLKNDDPDFQETMEPLVEETTESISEIGYNIHDIQYQQMTTPEPEQQDVEEEPPEENQTMDTLLPFYTEKGFDYKI